MSKKSMLIMCPVGTRSGYGAHSRDICAAAINSDLYDVMILPTPWGHTPNDGLDNNIQNHRLIISKLVHAFPQFVPDIFIQITIPNEFVRRGKFNIGITAGIETTMPPQEWIAGANKMDLIIFTSEHSKRTMSEVEYEIKNKDNTTSVLKLLKPSVVLFEGYDPGIFKKISVYSKYGIKPYLDTIPENFIFLHTGTWLDGTLGNDRKDIGMLVKTFCEAFKDVPKSKSPALLLKTSGANTSVSDKNVIQSKIRQITHMYGDHVPSIYLLHGNLFEEEMNELYNHNKIKAMVSLTHGEGFGRPLLEFSVTGKPILVSDWSGHKDFLNSKYTTLLPGKLEEVHQSAINKWIIRGSQWFRVDYNQAAFEMYSVFNKYSEYLERGGIQRNISKKYTLNEMQTQLVKIIDDALNSKFKFVEPERPKLSTITLPKLTKL